MKPGIHIQPGKFDHNLYDNIDIDNPSTYVYNI